jgi:hypothetical protein
MALTPAILSYVTTYRLETTQLEWTYDHRPQAIQPVIWSGDLYLVLQPEGAR